MYPNWSSRPRDEFKRCRRLWIKQAMWRHVHERIDRGRYLKVGVKLGWRQRLCSELGQWWTLSGHIAWLQWLRYTRGRQVKWPGWKIHRPRSALPIALLCFGNSANRKKIHHIWPLAALFVLFWQWNNLSGVGGLCVLRATTKKGRQLFRGKSASGLPGSRMFWPRNDLASLLSWCRRWINKMLGYRRETALQGAL